MKEELQQLIDLLDLERIEKNIFRGTSPATGWTMIYGGQVLSQGMVAAYKTVEDQARVAHSLHGYFLRPGDPSIPILYTVDRIRDGKSFTTRRVVAVQKGRAIANMAVSFQIMEEGLQHQDSMPDVPPPEKCLTMQEVHAQFVDDMPDGYQQFSSRPEPIEMRFVDPVDESRPQPMRPLQYVWMKTVDTMPDDMRLNQCVLAYASDMTLLDTSLRPHGISWSDSKLQSASLDHAMWFHRPARTDEWMLYVQESPNAGGARGFNLGSIYDQSGELLASAAQEGLIRQRD